VQVLVVDGTMPSEHAVRDWSETGHLKHVFGSVPYRSPFATIIRPLDASFHCILRNAYTPFGVVSASDPTRRVFELFWYTGDKYCSPVWDLHRLPHTTAPGFVRQVHPNWII